jgi:hypothetical protein
MLPLDRPRHRVDEGLGFFSSRLNSNLRVKNYNSNPKASVSPPFSSRGGGGGGGEHARLLERGRESHFGRRDRHSGTPGILQSLYGGRYRLKRIAYQCEQMGEEELEPGQIQLGDKFDSGIGFRSTLT